MRKKYKIGYLPMTADLFHVGHLRAIQKSKSKCDFLIIGLLTDAAIEGYKPRKTIYNFGERKEILGALSVVDQVVAQNSINPLANLIKYKADVMFSGDGFEPLEKMAAEKADVALSDFKYYEKRSTTSTKKQIKQNGKK